MGLVINLKSILNKFEALDEKANMEDIFKAPNIEDFYPIANEQIQDSGSLGGLESIQTLIPNYIRELYFYHPDSFEGRALRKAMLWLFSDEPACSAGEYITDMDGVPYQYLLYTPWGEALKDEKTSISIWESPYQFNGKELDEETGLYYYGARYYNPSVSVWLSVDAMAAKGPNITPYAFSHNNPVMLVDPDGNWPDDYDDQGITISSTTINNFRISNVPDKKSIDGADKVEQNVVTGTRFSRTDDDGKEMTVYREETTHRSATVDSDGVSQVTETTSVIERDSKGNELYSSGPIEKKYSYLEGDKVFADVVGLVKTHRDETRMTIGQHVVNNYSNGSLILGAPGTFLGGTIGASVNPVVGVMIGTAGVAGLGIGLGIMLGLIGPEDIQVNFGNVTMTP